MQVRPNPVLVEYAICPDLGAITVGSAQVNDDRVHKSCPLTYHFIVQLIYIRPKIYCQNIQTSATSIILQVWHCSFLNSNLTNFDRIGVVENRFFFLLQMIVTLTFTRQYTCTIQSFVHGSTPLAWKNLTQYKVLLSHILS